ncbi:RNA polymerase sigma factor [Nonomuraea sp. MTCD27]|uniref:RNA polymerase sigma factor n=1 Tax=Nonomuraea sp. MTCD27 TaxID=1676747 RepID=UPI0035C232B3
MSVLRGPGHRWIGDGRAPDEERGLAASGEDVVLLGVEHGDLGTALARLSPDLRAALQATVLDGLTTREAAHLLGVPEGTVKTRVMRGQGPAQGGPGMNREDWHVPGDLMDRYLTGRLEPAVVMSVEAHLTRCARCRAAVPYEEEWPAAGWERLEEEVDRPRRGRSSGC